MKTKFIIFTFILTVLAVAVFFSCENPISLGTKLDINGPSLKITSPASRKIVSSKFELKGTISDYTGVAEFIIKVSYSAKELPRQWRYNEGKWEISEDFGATWALFTGVDFNDPPVPPNYDHDIRLPVWNGNDKSASWSVPIDITGNEGEYTFSVLSWDKGGFADDNSFKSIVLIIDKFPPKVDVTTPYLYRNGQAFPVDPDFIEFDNWTDTSDKWQDPALLGKFLTQEFDLKWQIDEYNDIYSFEIGFYDKDVVIDTDPGTPLSDTNCIYKYYENLGPPPPTASASDMLKPNGTVRVPDLDKPAGTYDKDGKLINPISGKTTIKVVAVCYDAAKNPNQEKIIGYFIYWPKANKPWIVFTEGMRDPTDSYFGTGGAYGKPVIDASGSIDDKIFMIYPGKSIKGTAYQSQGVKEVKYTLKKLDTEGKVLNDPNVTGTPAVIIRSETISNPPFSSGSYPTTFAWDFLGHNITGHYLVEMTAFNSKGKESDKYTKLFRIQDITFPDFPTPPTPPAGDALFAHIQKIGGRDKIVISGIASDATNVKSVRLAWINPVSENYAAMSQLSYFREKDYVGWKSAENIPTGTKIEDGNYDPGAPNKVWNVKVIKNTSYIEGLTPENTDNSMDKNNRYLFRYSQEIDLYDDLLIGQTIIKDGKPKKIDLKSQTFLLRAENPDGKVTIITYAPQGDTKIPTVAVTQATVKKSGQSDTICYPNKYNTINEFTGGETIEITGTWEEDSLAYLSKSSYFTPNFEITINNKKFKVNDSVISQATAGNTSGGGSTTGTWTFSIPVVAVAPENISSTDYTRISANSLKDTLVVNVVASDIGGNSTEFGCSWLIKTDKIRLMRISSDIADGTYKAGDVIPIFLEFSKPVRLKNSGTPTLTLNSGGQAVYRTNPSQTAQNSRQYFNYTVGTNDTTATFLDVTGIVGGQTNPTGTKQDSTYLWTWYCGDLADKDNTRYEELRITTTASHNEDEDLQTGGYYRRGFPTGVGNQFALIQGKNIAIDTASPTVSSVTTTTAAGYFNAGDIYITVKFSEAVKISGVPQLTLQVGNTTYQTSATATDVRVSGDSISFKYTIGSNHTSNGNDVYVTTWSGGTITDIVGNPLASDAISSMTPANRTLTGVKVETTKPGIPTVKVLNSSTPTDIFSQNVNGGTRTGQSTTSAIDLANIYRDVLWLAIDGNTTPNISGNPAAAYKVARIEYTTNGTSWLPYELNTPIKLEQTGKYTIMARQYDMAGNMSNSTYSISFIWDPGNLVSRISSSNANGTYTQNSEEIQLTIYLRKDVYLAATTTPTITLNAQRGNTGSRNDISVQLNPIPGGAINSITFKYKVQDTAAGSTQPGDATPVTTPPTYLDIKTLTGITAWDGTAVGSGVSVGSLITLPTTTPKLDANKQFTVVTGKLSQTPAPSFVTDNTMGTGWNNESSSNYHGIRTDDGSYWTTLEIPFNRPITKGSGTITITQSATNYRLPAVLTETQYNRFRTVTGFDTYYIKGTNGFKYNGSNANAASDTSTKYVLKYNYDPNSSVTANNTGFTNNTAISSAFFDAFRTAEAVTIDINAEAVTITDSTGKTAGETGVGTLNRLRIRLANANALQTPGADYVITYTAGIITDDLGTSNVAVTGTALSTTLRGIAKPFVRINKTQDVIATGTGSTTAPRITATQPLLAYARLDCRTPGSAIAYRTSGEANNSDGSNTTNVTNRNWGTGESHSNNDSNGSNRSPFDNVINGPQDNANITVTRPNAPAGGTPYTESAQITFGYTTGSTSPLIGDVQGFQWWIRAVATKSGQTNSQEAEEMAFRTVITYQLRNLRRNQTGQNDRIDAGTGESTMLTEGNGNQVWIRGGDAIGSSSIPGFPFTWEDNWNALSGKRAGIRLMSLVNYNTDLNNSRWRFVTWDINATAYVDFIKGVDTGTSASVLWQYGPKEWYYQRSGWTSFKDKYPIYPGKHRWCDTGSDWAGKYSMNFSGTASGRDNFTNAGWNNVNTAQTATPTN